jgi:[ribosomal protein S18]-alanine N-acetyltransferase
MHAIQPLATVATGAAAGSFLPRAMRVADLPAVMAIEVQAYSHPWSEGNFADSLRAGYFAQLWCGGGGEMQGEMQGDMRGNTQGNMQGAVNADVLGYCVAMAGVDELHLLNITVAPSYQGQGWGRELLAAVQAYGQQRGLAQLLLEVRHSNQAAQRLYTRLGFAQVGLRRGYYPAGSKREDAVVMSLPLLPVCAPPASP